MQKQWVKLSNVCRNRATTNKDVEEFWVGMFVRLNFSGLVSAGRRILSEPGVFRYKYHFYLQNSLVAEKPMVLLESDAVWERICCNIGAECGRIDLTKKVVGRKRFELYLMPARTKLMMENLLSDNTFDVVYSFGVLHHTPDTQKAIDEVWRVLVPGGLAVIMLYNRKSLNYYIHRLINQPFDGNRKDRCPIERTYTKAQIFSMFQDFKKVNRS